MDREAGAIRVQRVPVTERSGRVHSSTVTVAVLAVESGADLSAYLRRNADDFRVEWYNGTIKAGGQHHQKNATCCRLTHLPTGIVKTAQTRSRDNSMRLAMETLVADLDRQAADAGHQAHNSTRRAQIGSGQKADRRRTFRFQDDRATDHVTGKSAPCAKVMAGRFDLLAA